MIVIARKKAFQARAVAYKVRIDDQVIGKVRNGTGATFLAEAGSHVVEIRATGARSKPVTVDVAEAGYHVLGTGPSKASAFMTIPAILVGTFGGRAVIQHGSPALFLVALVGMALVSVVVGRIPGLYITLAAIQQPPIQPWPQQPFQAPSQQPNGLPDLSDPTGRQAVWGEAPGQPAPPGQ